MTKCYLKIEPFKQCCCKCVFHKELKEHPWHKKPKSTNVCVATQDSGFVYPADEHGVGCELFKTKEIK